MSKKDTGTFLRSAVVRVEGTSLETTTDESGSYVLSNVPTGPARLMVSYLGLEGSSQTVTVSAGQMARQDFELGRDPRDLSVDRGVVELSKITVVADQEMSARELAMNEQRRALNIKSVVAFDEYTNDGRGDIGEYLKFVPGVSVNNAAASVRGLPGYATEVTMDGGPVASTERNETRSVMLLGMPIVNISRIEVTKVPTPDMPASAIGGSINIISRSGFERSKPLLSVSAYTLLNTEADRNFDDRNLGVPGSRSGHLYPSFDIQYLHPVNKTLAFSVGGSEIISHTQTQQNAPTWDLRNLIQSSYFSIINPTQQTIQDFNAGVDWKLGSRNVFNFGFKARNIETYILPSYIRVEYGAGATGGPSFTQGAATGVGILTQRYAWEKRNERTNHFTFSHKFTGENWKVDTRASLSQSRTVRSSPDFFDNVTAQITNLVIRGEGVLGTDDHPTDIIPSGLTVRDRNGVAVDPRNGNNYVFGGGTTSESWWERENTFARTDVTREFHTAIPFTLRAGGAITIQDYEAANGNLSYTFRPGVAATERLAGQYGLVDTEFSNGSQNPAFLGGQIQFVSPTKAFALMKSRPDYFVLNEPAAYNALANGSRVMKETITSGYIRGDMRLFQNHLNIVAGVRFERTQDKGAGPLNDPTAIYQRDANGNLIRNSSGALVVITTDALAQAKLMREVRGAKADREYDDLFPSLNLTYAITDNLVARAGFAETIGRPDLNLLLPNINFPAATANPQVITVTNTGLSPWRALNYDLSLESYILKNGFASIGVFQKNLENFFTTVTSQATPELLETYGVTPEGNNVTYFISTRGNGGDAEVRGFEASFKQGLDFLPHWARGIQVFANLTTLSVKGERTADFAGFNPRSLSWGASLTRPRFVVKFDITTQKEVRRTPVVASATIPEDTYQWYGPATRPTLSGEYRITKQIAIFGTLRDFLEGQKTTSLIYSRGANTPDYARISSFSEAGVNVTVGVKGNF